MTITAMTKPAIHQFVQMMNRGFCFLTAYFYFSFNLTLDLAFTLAGRWLTQIKTQRGLY
jgi:hypothetical protein